MEIVLVILAVIFGAIFGNSECRGIVGLGLFGSLLGAFDCGDDY